MSESPRVLVCSVCALADGSLEILIAGRPLPIVPRGLEAQQTCTRIIEALMPDSRRASTLTEVLQKAVRDGAPGAPSRGES